MSVIMSGVMLGMVFFTSAYVVNAINNSVVMRRLFPGLFRRRAR